jgi:GTP cyclohydrolase II
LGANQVRLMTNNPRKIKALKELGINVVDRESIQADSNPHNIQYLSTKAGKLGHMFKEEK